MLYEAAGLLTEKAGSLSRHPLAAPFVAAL